MIIVPWVGVGGGVRGPIMMVVTIMAVVGEEEEDWMEGEVDIMKIIRIMALVIIMMMMSMMITLKMMVGTVVDREGGVGGMEIRGIIC